MEALDLFAGAGGWDVACRLLGVNPLGIEIDGAACATRKAAGHRTLQGDVAALNPTDFAPCELLIASPPCTAFSTAGKREGMKDLPLIFEAASALALGEVLPDAGEWRDQRSALVLEPLRWALALRPDYLAWEQVPPVLEFWELCATILGKSGYHCWTGNLFAEQYGVPQTRKRAILMVSREQRVRPPAPTHQRYVSPPKEDEDAPESLFEAPRADRRVRPEDRNLLPWVSMAEALGWSPDDELEYQRGEGMKVRHGDRPNRQGGEPAFTVRGGTGGVGTGMKRRLRSGQNTGAGERAERGVDEPSVAITSRADNNSWVYDRPAPTVVSTRRSDKGIVVGRQLPEGERRDVGGHGWVEDRPATSLVGDERVFGPHAGSAGESQSSNAVRVSLEEAAILQSFRPDYPVQGTKSQRFLQVGNAVPPALALPILGELLDIDWKPIQFEYLATYTQPAVQEEAA